MKKGEIFVMAILLMIALPLMAEFQIWGGVTSIFDSTKAAIIESLGIDFVFVSTVYDSPYVTYAFPPLTGHARTDLSLLPDGVKTMAQQIHCEDAFGYLKEVYAAGQGSAVLRAAAAHYESWEAESTMVPDGIPSEYLYRTWFDNSIGSVITTTEDTARGGKYVRFTGDTGVVLIAPIAYHEDSTDFNNVKGKVSRQYGYYKQNDGGGQNWHKYEVVREGDTASVPIVPYTLSIDVRADTSSLPASGDVLVFGVYLNHVQDCSDYSAFYDSVVLDADTFRTLVESGWTGFNTFSFQYTWENAWEDTNYSRGWESVDVYKKYLFFNYRVKLLDEDAIIDIDRIVCWDEPIDSITPPNDNGWGKYIFEPELPSDSLNQDTIWLAVKDQIDDFYETGVSNAVYGIAGVTEQCRLSNQWAAAKKFTQFISDTFGLRTDFIMASAPPEFVYSYLYYANPTFNRRTTQRIRNNDYTGIDTTSNSTFQGAMQNSIAEYREWGDASSITGTTAESNSIK